jgi:diacylglycerol O-acyltransferase / wax synthase
MAVDALSALDECFLRLETDAAPMHIGWTMFVEGKPPGVSELRAHVSARLERLPRFRRRVLSSRLMLHDPMWVDDERFDIAEHVRVIRVPQSGGPPATRRIAGELLSTPLDLSRPLWRLCLLDGLEADRFAIVGQVHHALVDGVAAVEMAELLLDGTPVSAPATAPQFAPGPPPRLFDRAKASLAERLELTRTAGSVALRTLGSPAEASHELRRVGSVLSSVGARAPVTVLNQPIGAGRSVAFTRLSLQVARQLGRRHGATVNDVVLAASSLALGRYLRRCGESHPWLRALVPVNTRRPDARGGRNRTAAMFIELPIGERQPRAVLQEISRQTREHKHGEQAGVIDALVQASRLAPLPLRDAGAWMLARPQTFNAALSTIPGPAAPVFLLGRRVQSAYPAVPLVQGHGLSIAALSYCGALHVGLYAAPEVVPDVVDVSHDLTSSFDALRLALEPTAPTVGGPTRPRPRRRIRAQA